MTTSIFKQFVLRVSHEPPTPSLDALSTSPSSPYSLRAQMRTKKPITFVALFNRIFHYFDAFLSKANQTQLLAQLFTFDKRGQVNGLTLPLIEAIKAEASRNVIAQNPGKTTLAFLCTLIFGFGASLLGIALYEWISGLALSASLPFLSGFGALGASLLFACTLTLSALILLAVCTTIIALATHKKIEIEMPLSATPQMQCLGPSQLNCPLDPRHPSASSLALFQGQESSKACERIHSSEANLLK